jgi:hypothetical protein
MVKPNIMKKIILFASLIIAAVSVTFVSCNKENVTNEVTQTTEVFEGRKCAAHDVLQEDLKNDPSLQKRMDDIERFTDEFVSQRRLLSTGVIQIPVVVNVLYKTTAQNISDAQIQSQITALNNDFKALNTDYNNTPSLFQPLRSGNFGIEFVLDTVIRKSTTVTSWSTNNNMKKASSGGINPTSPTTKLNFWVCNMGNGILGYAQFPGGAAATDGVVIDDNAFGTVGTVTSPFNKGRTATHEVGHWLNLRHIWGDATCGSDLVSDTPQHNAANYNCPTYPHYSTCTGTPIEMTMNYMDYTNDACMYMFTTGQKTRAMAVFAVGGPRNSFAQP